MSPSYCTYKSTSFNLEALENSENLVNAARANFTAPLREKRPHFDPKHIIFHGCNDSQSYLDRKSQRTERGAIFRVQRPIVLMHKGNGEKSRVS